jgi:hypothetical protein
VTTVTDGSQRTNSCSSSLLTNIFSSYKSFKISSVAILLTLLSLAVAARSWSQSAPTVSPAAGTYAGTQLITISDDDPSATIYYTLNGFNPTTSSTVYSGPISISGPIKIRAIAVDAGVSSSVSLNAFVVTGVPTRLYFSKQPGNPAAGKTIPVSYIAVLDGMGHPVTTGSYPVTVTIGNNPGSGILSGTVAETVVAATSATFLNLSISGAGTGYTLVASTPLLPSITSAPFNLQPPVWTRVAGAIPASYFGMQTLNFTQIKPTLTAGTTRTWDAYNFYGVGLSWADLNPSSGVYNWSALDQFIANASAQGQDVIYTFGRTPTWASSEPTQNSSYGPGECAPPANLSNWTNFVQALVAHAGGQIKYWELWNEPDLAQTYCGSIPTLVTMGQQAATIIQNANPTAQILTPAVSSASGATWLGEYLSAGGAQIAQVLAFHGYASNQGEGIVSLVNKIKATAQSNGAGSLPMWDTESGWGGGGSLATSQQPGFVAKYYLLQWSLGLQRAVWYAYDGTAQWGELYTASTGPTNASTAYEQVNRWMVGSEMTQPCAVNSSGVWICGMTMQNGISTEAVWIPNSTGTIEVPSQYIQYADLAGNVYPISGSTVAISDQPILLETGDLQ